MLKFVLNVIHSILENKVEHHVQDVLTNLTKNMDLHKKKQLLNVAFLFCKKRKIKPNIN